MIVLKVSVVSLIYYLTIKRDVKSANQEKGNEKNRNEPKIVGKALLEPYE